MLDTDLDFNRFEKQVALWNILQRCVADHPISKKSEEGRNLAQLTQDIIEYLDKATRYANNGNDRAIEQFPINITDRIKNLSLEKKMYLGDIMSLLIHLQRSASISVADAQQKDKKENSFTIALEKMKESPRQGNALNVEEILNTLRLPVMDNVFTAHPTFIGDLKYTKHIRKLDRKIAEGNNEAIAEALSTLLTMHSIVDQPMEVKDETEFMRHFFTNAYNAVPDLYAQAEAAIDRAKYSGEYDPLQLKLQLRFQSWGSSGDKDGNKKVNYVTTRDAIETHRVTMIDFYQEDLRYIMSILPDNLKELYSDMWQGCHAMLDNISRNTLASSSDDIEKAKKQLRMAALTIYTNVKGEHPEIASRALGLIRKIDTFGMAMGDIEYRETAEVNAKILDFIIDEKDITDADVEPTGPYSGLPRPEREKVINHLLDSLANDKGKAEFQNKMRTALMHKLRHVKSHHHDYAEPESVFFHSIMRLKLAKDNPDMIRGQVLAEAESPTEFKEMLALLKLTECDEHMRIIPLFEDPAVLAKVGEVMRDIQTDKHVYRYLVNLSLNEWKERAEKGYVPTLPEHIEKAIRDLPDAMDLFDHWDAECKHINDMIEKDPAFQKDRMHWQLSDIIQTQVQMAHSDNSRRGGIVGARASLFKAHDEAAHACDRLHLGMQFHEGGSHTDSFRMGMRSYRSLVNTYDNHEFMKSTVQGMDLAQIFSNPITIQHFLGENLANSAYVAAQKRADRGKKTSRYLPEDNQPKQQLRKDKSLLSPFINQIENYQKDYFENPLLGYAMEQIFEYSKNKLAGTQGSRAAGRDSKTGQEITIDKDGYQITDDSSVRDDTRMIDMAVEKKRAPYLDPVHGTRTIGYSETLQHAGLNPIFIGFKQLREPLLNLACIKAEGAAARTGLASLFAGKSEPQKLHTLYRHNPAVRDIVDRVAYSVAASDFEEVWRRAREVPGNDNDDDSRIVFSTAAPKKDSETGKVRYINHTATYGEDQTIDERPALSDLEEKANQENSMEGFIAGLELEYREAAKFALEAIKGEEVDITNMQTKDLTAMAQKSLLMYRDHFAAMGVAMNVAKTIETSTSTDDAKKAMGKDDNSNYDIKNALNKTIHYLRDMATLVRSPFQAEWNNRGHKPSKEANQAMTVS